MRLARAAKSMVPGLKSWEGKFLIFSLGNDLRHKSHWTFRPAWCFTTRKTVLVLEINVFELCSDASPARRGRRWRRPGRRWRGPRGIWACVAGCPGGRIRAAAGDAYKQSWVGRSVSVTITVLVPARLYHPLLYLEPFHLGETCRVDRLSAQGEIHRAGWVLPSSNHVHKPIFLKKKAFIEQRVQVQQPIRLTGSWWLVLIYSERKVLLSGCW
jgi:hypothetical protein